MAYKYLDITLPGQLPSGKNSVVVTRTGHRFPNKRFVEWRKGALVTVAAALKSWENINKSKWEVLSNPVNVIIEYYPADKRRRDVPGMLDALWHLLEKAQIVTDDRWLGGYDTYVHWNTQGQCPGGQTKIALLW